LQFCNDFQIPLAMTDKIGTPLACRVRLAGVVLPDRAFKLRNELPDLVHDSVASVSQLSLKASGSSRAISLGSEVARVVFEILRTHSSWLGNGPEDKLPSSSIAYQPGLMLRMSDLFSLT
jgi:hypothetical protein